MPRKPALPDPEPIPQDSPLAVLGDLDLFSIQGQWEGLRERGSGGVVRVDVSGAGDLDASGVQLLAALERDLRAKGGRLELAGVKEDWQARFEGLGWTGAVSEVGP